jgi:hypothetical protein
VAYRSWVLNQTDAKTLVANLTLGVAICGHEPNNLIYRQTVAQLFGVYRSTKRLEREEKCRPHISVVKAHNLKIIIIA